MPHAGVVQRLTRWAVFEARSRPGLCGAVRPEDTREGGPHLRRGSLSTLFLFVLFAKMTLFAR